MRLLPARNSNSNPSSASPNQPPPSSENEILVVALTAGGAAFLVVLMVVLLVAFILHRRRRAAVAPHSRAKRKRIARSVSDGARNGNGDGDADEEGEGEGDDSSVSRSLSEEKDAETVNKLRIALPGFDGEPGDEGITPAFLRNPNFKLFRQQSEPSSIPFTVYSAPPSKEGGAFSVAQLNPEIYKAELASLQRMRPANSQGSLFVTLAYDTTTEKLQATIVRAEGLPAKDFSGTSDPYVKCYVLPDRKVKHQTRVHRKTLMPEFNETFEFQNISLTELQMRTVVFAVYDFDRFSRHDFIGTARVDLADTDLSTPKNLCLDLSPTLPTHQDSNESGELLVSLCYLPAVERLTATIIKARNLRPMDISGTSDPYVKIELILRGKRIKKRKTEMRKRTLNPVFNESFIFDVSKDDLAQVALLLTVLDYDRIGRNEVIGSVLLGQVSGPGEATGRKHWLQMISQQRKPVAQWHVLRERNQVLEVLRTNSRAAPAMPGGFSTLSSGSAGFAAFATGSPTRELDMDTAALEPGQTGEFVTGDHTTGVSTDGAAAHSRGSSAMRRASDSENEGNAGNTRIGGQIATRSATSMATGDWSTTEGYPPIGGVASSPQITSTGSAMPSGSAIKTPNRATLSASLMGSEAETAKGSREATISSQRKHQVKKESDLTSASVKSPISSSKNA